MSAGHMSGCTGDTWHAVQVMTSAVRRMTSAEHATGRTGDDVSDTDDDVSMTCGRSYRGHVTGSYRL
jgi:hypothetical protein